jgi:hypothetical protein
MVDRYGHAVRDRGHVFVVRGDATRIACSWRVIPCGTDAGHRPGEVLDRWRADPRVDRALSDPDWPDRAPDERRRATVVVGPQDEAPGVIAAHSGGVGSESAAWFAEALRAAVEVARADGREPTLPRTRPLIVTPLLGTQAGGAGGRRAGVLEQMLAVAEDVAEDGVDVAIVVTSQAAYSAAQRVRASDGVARWQNSLTLQEIEHAEQLATHARAGRLVVFLGAGVGMAAGLPSWKTLLTELGHDVGITDATSIDELGRMDPRDAAQVLEKHAGGADTLTALLRRRFTAVERPSLAHGLLASLPIREAATTNYDDLFERAWAAATAERGHDAAAEIAVVPRDDPAGADRWLLKVHGDVNADGPLVLSREEYARFERGGGAVASLLSALLLTRHLLIVGYSLSDETFHRIAGEVRALRRTQVANLVRRHADEGDSAPGTVLTVESWGLFAELWNADLSIVDLAQGGAEDATRRLEIFLDLVGHLSAPVEAYVLGAGWQELTDHGPDRALRDALDAMRSLPPLSAPLQRAVEATLERFGGRSSESPGDQRPSH